MKILLIALLSFVMFYSSDAAAEKPTQWEFGVYNSGPEIYAESYNDDLGQTVAVSLPISMTKTGWSCVRKEVGGYASDNGFQCSNGVVEFDNMISCEGVVFGKSNWMVIKSGDTVIEFNVECWH